MPKALLPSTRVVRLRRHADVDGRALVEPPEQLRARERLAAFLRAPCAPSRTAARPGSAGCDCCQKRTSFVSRKSQPLRDDAVFARQLAGQQRRLGRAGDGRQHLRHVRDPARRRDGFQSRGVFEQVGA